MLRWPRPANQPASRLKLSSRLGGRSIFAIGCSTGLMLALLATLLAGFPGNSLAVALTGMMTPLIAIIGAYIAFQQWKTNHQKLQFDRYARRLQVYEHVRNILGVVGRDAAVDFQEVLAFRRAVSEADFLYGPEIVEYIDEIYRHGVKLGTLKSERMGARDNQRVDFDYEKNANEHDAELRWFLAQFDEARERFGTYLNMY
jgi:hypothetical protein